MKLSLSSSPQIDMIRGEQIGAMGADNVALQLTHRFILKRRWNLVVPENTLPCPGIKLNESEVRNIDIGQLPVLETLAGDGVGGILGADLLMICDVVRFSGLNSSSPKMILMLCVDAERKKVCVNMQQKGSDMYILINQITPLKCICNQVSTPVSFIHHLHVCTINRN